MDLEARTPPSPLALALTAPLSGSPLRSSPSLVLIHQAPMPLMKRPLSASEWDFSSD